MQDPYLQYTSFEVLAKSERLLVERVEGPASCSGFCFSDASLAADEVNLYVRRWKSAAALPGLETTSSNDLHLKVFELNKDNCLYVTCVYVHGALRVPRGSLFGNTSKVEHRLV